MNFTPDEALTLAKEIARFLKQAHGATRVLFFGSRAKGVFTSESDIDVYFERVPRDLAFRVVGDCIARFGEDDINYCPGCFCEARFYARVLAHGISL